ncbi:MAG TPA: VOC family protein [Thermoanaerobaculia bacterium]|nr:VOC family protein [Thermoanaerobaculia bacterium]
MPEFTSHEPGTFCWVELATNDVGAAKKFYMDLFGWGVNELSMGPDGNYYIFTKNGKDCAAMYQLTPEMAGMPPNWMSYVSVTNADAVAEQIKSLGGNVVKAPFDVMDQGRMAVIADPQGAYFCIWQPKQGIGVHVRDEPDTLCWNELQARDVDAAKKFYSGLGWGMKESPEYTEWKVGEKAIGGMMQSQAPPQVPSYWMPYFAVADCDASVAKAKSGGANVFAGPMDYPGVGRFAVLGDAQGAVFAVIKLELGPHA